MRKPAFLLHPAVFLISAVGIAYQIALMRIFSITQWHHFAYMIISIAMLGFGASGTALTLIKSRIAGREQAVFFAAALAMAISLRACYDLSQRIPFETFHLVSQPDQLIHLFLLYIVLAVPFFLVSTCLALAFFIHPRAVGRVYFVNLIGSGAGALLVVGLLYHFLPEQLPNLLSYPALLAAGLLIERRYLLGWVAAALAVVAYQFALPTELRLSEYKILSYLKQLPDAEIVATARSPLSKVEAVTSGRIRETPGQISNYPMHERGPLPEQAGLVFDAGSMSVINRFDGSLERMAYLDYVTPALPYHLLDRPRVLVIGAGGGTDVLMALLHGARHVTAVEVDPSVFPLIRDRFAEFSGRLYERADVTPLQAEGRGYLQSSAATYDLIQIALLDSFNAAASGVYALSESYLYTREAVELYIRHLTDDGILAVTRWLKTPPRDAIKMFATLVEAAERAGIEDPGRHLAFIRSWNTGTLLISRSPLTPEQVESIRRFSRSRWFDISYYPGIEADEVNRYIELEEELYHRAALAILSGERERFYDRYLFHVRPATDDRPHFFQFFRWNTLHKLIRDMGLEWVPFMEWGYIALLATIVQGGVVSFIFILLPLIVLRRDPAGRGARGPVFLYFACLGLGFMFLEIAFIQKFMLFLNYPIYAVAVVLTAFLVFSGVGSFLADRWRSHRSRLVAGAVAGIAAVAMLYNLLLPALFSWGAGWSDGLRIAVSVVLLAPLALCMGVPFPSGLQWVSDRHSAMVPWAWGINGFASVMGASLATFTAIHLGFRLLVLLSLAIYLLAGCTLWRLDRRAADSAVPSMGRGWVPPRDQPQ